MGIRAQQLEKNKLSRLHSENPTLIAHTRICSFCWCNSVCVCVCVCANCIYLVCHAIYADTDSGTDIDRYRQCFINANIKHAYMHIYICV